jgi:hypothetical protein
MSSTLIFDPMIDGCELLQFSHTEGNVSSLQSNKFPRSNSPRMLDSVIKVLLVPEQSNPLMRRAILLILDFSSYFLLEKTNLLHRLLFLTLSCIPLAQHNDLKHLKNNSECMSSK